jgi:hypothetical protein
MAGGNRRKCKCCLKLFRPDPRNRHHQRYCSEAACRAASKAASQARWRAAPDRAGEAIKPDYDQVSPGRISCSRRASTGRLRSLRRRRAPQHRQPGFRLETCTCSGRGSDRERRGRRRRATQASCREKTNYGRCPRGRRTDRPNARPSAPTRRSGPRADAERALHAAITKPLGARLSNLYRSTKYS